MIQDLTEESLLDLRAQLDDANPHHTILLDVGVVQSLTKMALRALEDS